MDPFTHALLGASTAQVLCGGRLGRRAALIGALAGVLPDAEFFIRSSADPLLNIEVHRQFTHALAFIPLGALLAALPWLLRPAGRARGWWVLLAAASGYATHGVLDACTNYGTELLWPFVETRFAWNLLTTIGPLFTLLLLLGLFFALRRQRRWPAALGLAGVAAYTALAAWQQGRAFEAQAALAQARGQVIERGRMFPTLGNFFVWRSLYESGGRLYGDRIRAGGALAWKPGATIELVAAPDLLPAELADANAVRDFRRFARFSDGWVARSPEQPEVYGDARYSLDSARFAPIWGVRLHPGALPPVEWVDFTRQNPPLPRGLWREISGADADYRPLPAPPALRRAEAAAPAGHASSAGKDQVRISNAAAARPVEIIQGAGA